MFESISTGARDIGSPSLWGSSNGLPTSGGADSSSSLLRHLINDTGDRTSTNESSLFGELGKDDESRRQIHSIW
jgi:hypothetical protein